MKILILKDQQNSQAPQNEILTPWPSLEEHPVKRQKRYPECQLFNIDDLDHELKERRLTTAAFSDSRLKSWQTRD